MVDSFPELGKAIMDSSYRLYDDIKSVSSAFDRISYLLGRQPTTQNEKIIPPEAPLKPPSEPVKPETVKPSNVGLPVIKGNVQQEAKPPASTAAHPAQTVVMDKKNALFPKIGDIFNKIPLKPPKKPAETQKQLDKNISQKASKPYSYKPTEENNGQKDKEQEISKNNPISKLLSLVKEKRSIKLGDAARELNVPREVAEIWAKILKESSLINIKYQFVGDIILEA